MPLCSGSVVTSVFLTRRQQWKSVAVRFGVDEGMWVHASATSVCVSEQMFPIKLIVSSARLMNTSSVGKQNKKGRCPGNHGKEETLPFIDEPGRPD